MAVLDGAGDLRDSAGVALGEPQPAGDLRRVVLFRDATGGGEALVARFELAGPVPARADTIVWSVQVRDGGGTPVATLSAQLLGARLVAGIYDWRAEQQVPVEVARGDSTLTVTVPPEALVNLDLPPDGTWSAMAQVDEGFEDVAGEDEPLPPPATPLPGAGS